MECGNVYLRFFLVLVLVHTGWMESNFIMKESCLCPETVARNLTFECTTVGPGITIWRGTAFNCASQGHEIALRHSLFRNPEGASGQCNSGNITGHSLGEEHGHFISQIHVLFSPDLLGRTIECTHNNINSYELIGNSSIVITTDPFPPPDDISLSEIRPGPELRFNWTRINCQMISYSITSDCGNCPTSTAINTAVCINVPVDDRVCSFAVRTVVCGNIDGTQSNSLSVTLKVPHPPSVDAIPLYSHETGRLVGIKTTFMEPASFNVTNRVPVDGGAISYTITYTEISSDNVCGTKVILASSCLSGVCTHFFDLSSSNCGSVPISVRVSATNILGSGAMSTPVSILDIINNVFNLTFDLSSNAAICIFPNRYESNTIKTCTLLYNQSESCLLDSPALLSQTVQSASNTVRVSLPFVNNLHDGNRLHCFVVSASNGTYTAIVRGTLNTDCDPNHLYDGPTVTSLEGAKCDKPLIFIGASGSDGYACYSGTLVGAYAVHHCLNCDYRSVRVCMPNGNWNGTTLQCKCTSLNEPFQRLLSIMIPVIIILFTLSLAFVIITAFVIRKSGKNRAKVKVLQAQVMELSTVYEEVDSKSQQLMEENMAYNTVQEFQETVKPQDIPA